MTRMPQIQQAVADFFEREPCKGVHPDESVALGAGIQGSALVDDKQEMVLLDVTPHALGIMTQGGYFEELIPQNTTVPTHRTKIFTTSRDNQTAVKIVVMQGESERAEENELLGEFILTGLRRAAQGHRRDRGHLRDQRRRHRQRPREGPGDGQGAVDRGHRVERPDARRDQGHDGGRQGLHGRAPLDRGVRGRQAGGRALVGEIERLFPQVEQIVAASDFGRDAIEKARAIVAKARAAIAKRDVAAVKAEIEGLSRTHRMFKGVVAKTH